MEKHSKVDMNIDCWDFKNCPQDRKKGCLAFSEEAGKKCWLVTGTMCGGVEQKDMRTKIAKCRACEFYKMRDGIAG